MKGKHILIFSLVAVGAIVSIWVAYQVKLFQKFAYSFTGYYIKKLSLSDTQIEVFLDIDNKSDVDITVTGYDVAVSLNDKYLGNFQAHGLNTVVKAHKNNSVTLNVNFNPTETLRNALGGGNITTFFTDKSRLIFGFKGKISLGTVGITLNNFKINERISLADMIPNSGKSKKPTIV